MNREDIIRMAREAGFYVDEKARQNQPNCISHTYHMIDNQLERFAALVAASEREACAMQAWALVLGLTDQDTADIVLRAIRARGQA